MSGFVETAPDPVLRCERCGRALASADSICDCEAEIAAAEPAAAGTAGGTHVCPVCNGRFDPDRLRTVRWTPGRAWYRNLGTTKACPHCAALLRSRYPQGWSRFLALLAIALIIGSHLFGLLPRHDDLLRAALWLAFLLLTVRSMASMRRDPQAYERDPR